MARERGFENIDDMDEELIAKWNERIKPGDVVYHLGDFSFRKAEETIGIIRRLNGAIRLIKGNHDKVVKGEVMRCFEWVKDYYEGKGPNDVKIVMCHTAFLVWNKSHYGAWNICGHSHGSLKPRDAKQMDVGVDTNNLYPYTMEEVSKIMDKRGFETVDHHSRRDRSKK